jgi:hypothetical protein
MNRIRNSLRPILAERLAPPALEGTLELKLPPRFPPFRPNCPGPLTPMRAGNKDLPEHPWEARSSEGATGGSGPPTSADGTPESSDPGPNRPVPPADGYPCRGRSLRPTSTSGTRPMESWVEEHLLTELDETSHRFTVQVLAAEAGLYAFPARYYDPQTSR